MTPFLQGFTAELEKLAGSKPIMEASMRGLASMADDLSRLAGKKKAIAKLRKTKKGEAAARVTKGTRTGRQFDLETMRAARTIDPGSPLPQGAFAVDPTANPLKRYLQRSTGGSGAITNPKKPWDL